MNISRSTGRWPSRTSRDSPRSTERLARQGKVGAEEMSDILSDTFAALFDAARPDGADLIKWGGDAILLLFRRA